MGLEVKGNSSNVLASFSSSLDLPEEQEAGNKQRYRISEVYFDTESLPLLLTYLFGLLAEYASVPHAVSNDYYSLFKDVTPLKSWA